MGGGFDFDVIERSWVYLFREGMSFTVTLTLLATMGDRTRYATGPDAIVLLPNTEPDRRHLCKYHAVIAARFGDFLVFLSGSLYRWLARGQQSADKSGCFCKRADYLHDV